MEESMMDNMNGVMEIQNDGTKNKRIRIEIKDWLFNAGILGLYRILQHAEKEVQPNANYIECDVSAFENFENSFFQYFIDTYGKDNVWHKLTEFCQVNFDWDKLAETGEEKIKAFLDNFEKDLIKASLLTAYFIIANDKEVIKNKLAIIKDKTVSALEKLQKIKEIYDFFMEHKAIIQAKYTSYQVINLYWEGVSFLNKQQVGLNMFGLYKKDFVDPFARFLTPETKKAPYGNCMICNREVNKKSDASQGLSWLKMDLDSARKTSAYWNHQLDINICPVCNLVYSCIPAGFVTFKRKGIFINDNSGSARLIGINAVLVAGMENIKNMESLEEITYTHIINLIQKMRDENQKKEIANIQVIKIDGDKGYSFNLLSKQVLQVIEKSKKELDFLAERYDVFLDNKTRMNLYKEVIERIYRNIDLYPLIYMLLAMGLRKKKKDGAVDALFKINMNFIGGQMSDKKIFVMKQMGLNLKKGYKEEENKINGIAYRLLNYLKTKNINGFMDVIINCHMHIGKEIPTLFVECIDDVERFQAYGYAFLLGFTGEEYKSEAKTVNA